MRSLPPILMSLPCAAERRAGACAIALTLLAGCSTTSQSRRIIVPDDQLKQSDYTPDGVIPRSRYVLRMTDGKRDWEVEFPEVATGYEVRIPLEGEPKALQSNAAELATPADKEIADDMVRQNPDLAPPAKERLGPDGKPLKVAPRLSYLAGLAEIRDLFRSRNYEIALLKVVELEKDYPVDDKLLAMKGSLYRQLGRTELARDAWERALKINPQNQVVADALERLNSQQGSDVSPPAAPAPANPHP